MPLGAAPSAADVYATGDPKVFRKHGKIIGENCRAMGFNVDFAPALDLAFEASRSVLGTRAVSADPLARPWHMPAQFLAGLGRLQSSWVAGNIFPDWARASSTAITNCR